MTMLRPAILLFIFLALITGGLYPLVTTALGQWWFKDQANGSLIMQNGENRGSRLIGQSFTDARYFQGRPSATAESPYNPMASGGSNLAGSNPALDKAVAEKFEAEKQVELERQNQELLAQMNRRAKLQLHLQETVEGLSVVAITYYASQLVQYLAKGVKHQIEPLTPEGLTAAAIPVIALIVALGTRRMRKHLAEAEAFFDKYGGRAIVLARFVPIVRTYVPLVAGMARHSYRHFVGWNLLGGALWVGVLVTAGVLLGHVPAVANNIELISVNREIRYTVVEQVGEEVTTGLGIWSWCTDHR